MAQVQVRQAVVDDASAIAEIHVRSWHHAYRGLVPDAVLDALGTELLRELWLLR